MSAKVETFYLASYQWYNSGCEKFGARVIDCAQRCNICGVEEKSINHFLFECPPALQTWVLSKIPSPLGVFPSPSMFTNMNYLFWRLPREYDFSSFPWILWYNWKNRNNTLYSNKNDNPQEILRIAEVEAVVLVDAHLTVPVNHQSSLSST